MKCATCGENDPRIAKKGDDCGHCSTMKEYAAFAGSCGLTRFPDPSGERYIYRTDLGCDGKKGECVEHMDELWNALCRAKGRDDLTI